MSTEIKKTPQSEVVFYLHSAIASMMDALVILEADGNNNDEAFKLWRIIQSAVSLRAKYEFLYRYGIWSILKNSNV